jgi:hypothetical protein
VAPNQRTHPPRRSQKRIVVRKKTSALDDVRDGVRRFILSDASIGDFHRALRLSVNTGRLSPNPLTGPTLRKIIKEVIDERKDVAKRNREQSQKRKERRRAKTQDRDH